MKLGAFSVSLAVKDLTRSMEFYQKLGFEQVGGDPTQNWIVLGNGSAKIGLFQGMFKDNILTFNPGWAQDKTQLKEFEDVRDIQALLKENGIELLAEADPESTGVAHIMLNDPDGNQILIDQHVPKP
jgi:catechol 2,3-dioxygenase-like lactoylglutathione lyase family enzyme